MEWKIHKASLRQPVAAADTKASSADLDTGHRLNRDMGLLRRARLQLQLSFVQRVQACAQGTSGLLGPDGCARQRAEPLQLHLLSADMCQRYRPGVRGRMVASRQLLLQ